MNRGYTVADYTRLVKKIRTKVKDVIIGTDIIVGFPTETKTEFNQTVKLAKTINWDIAFVARYSPRPGTAADRLYPDDVPAAEKKRRWEILDQILNKDKMTTRPKVMS
jgi:tRNA-2-methylthio-N6-dimethylallyladenosine synthase